MLDGGGTAGRPDAPAKAMDNDGPVAHSLARQLMRTEEKPFANACLKTQRPKPKGQKQSPRERPPGLLSDLGFSLTPFYFSVGLSGSNSVCCCRRYQVARLIPRASHGSGSCSRGVPFLRLSPLAMPPRLPLKA